MNISAALSINTNMIGGSANGSYIDSDKFKQSDINYFVQVRVTNQRLDGKPYSRLNLVNSVRNNQVDPKHDDEFGGQKDVNQATEVGSIDQDKFREVYGVRDIPKTILDFCTDRIRIHLSPVGKKVVSSMN